MIRNRRLRVKGRTPARDGRRSRKDGRRKPSSVTPGPAKGRLGAGSFIWDPNCFGPLAAYPGLGRDRRSLVPYLALLRMGFAMRPLLPAARCALTAPFHPCLCPRRRGPSAVCSLRHFPSPRGARALPGILPCGARTFLHRRARCGTPCGDPSARPPGSPSKVARKGAPDQWAERGRLPASLASSSPPEDYACRLETYVS